MKLTTSKRQQLGQSMVEYVVITAALVSALLLAGLGSVGLSKNDDQSLLQAVHERYTDQAYALSISEIPEGRDLTELADYYDEMGKYPTLADNLATGAETLADISRGISDASDVVSQLGQYTDPQNVLNLIDTDVLVDEIENELESAVEDALNPF